MSVKSSKSGKKAAAKKPTSKKKVVARKKPASKLSKSSKPKSAVKSAKVSKAKAVKKPAAKRPTASKGRPADKITKAVQVAKAELKSLLSAAAKKTSAAKQAMGAMAKKLKTERDNLAKVTQKHTAKPSAALNKQMGSAKNKVHLAQTAHSKAETNCNTLMSAHAVCENQLQKIMHVEQSLKDLLAAWDKKHANVGKVVSPAKTAPAVKTNATTSKPVNKTSQPTKNKGKTQPSASPFGSLNNSSWTNFDDKKSNPMSAKVTELAESDADDVGNPWRSDKN